MRENRQRSFDSNRGFDIEEMATPEEVQALRQALQQMQQQHQQEIVSLRQQLAAQPNGLFQLTPDQILNKFQNIRTFYGRDDYSLQEFISSVENIAGLCANNQPLLLHGLSMIFKEKIQGEAKRCIQRLGDNLTWDGVKAELKIHFRPRKSYKRLMDESRNIKVNNLRELFNIIRSINCQLNELYEFDDNKPSNYSPENNDKNLVDIIKDMITGSYRTNITRKITLINIFNTFDDLDLLDEHDVIHYKYRRNAKEFRNNNNAPRKENKHENQEKQRSDYYRNNYNHSDQIKNSSFRSNNYRYNSEQYRNTNNNNNPEQFRQSNYFNNNNSGQLRQRQNNNYNSGQFRQNNNYNSGQFRQRQNNNNNSGQFRQRQSSITEPMEIDNVQEQDVNFTNRPREVDYP